MAKWRTGIPGVPGLGKVVNETAWGESKATERYGGSTKIYPATKSQAMPQDPMDKPADKTFGDMPVSSWLRGGGESGKPRR